MFTVDNSLSCDQCVNMVMSCLIKWINEGQAFVASNGVAAAGHQQSTRG